MRLKTILIIAAVTIGLVVAFYALRGYTSYVYSMGVDDCKNGRVRV